MVVADSHVDVSTSGAIISATTTKATSVTSIPVEYTHASTYRTSSGNINYRHSKLGAS